MIRVYARMVFLTVTVLVFSQCQQKKTTDPAAFHTMLQNYWKDYYALHPMDATVFGDYTYNDKFENTCTQAYRDKLKNFYQRYTDSLKAYELKDMETQDALSYKVLAYDLNTGLESLKFDSWKIPFTQMGDSGNTLSANMVMAIGQYGSGESAQPFKTLKDYEDWLKRVQAYTVWCDSAIANFKQGMAAKYVLPKKLVVKMVDVCQGLVHNDIQQSIFYGPVKKMPATFSKADKDRITAAYTKAIKEELNVSNARLASFLKNTYLPAASDSSGIGSLPNGAAYYRFLVKSWTTTDKSLDEIYQTGLSEVKRIHQEMEKARQAAGYKGDLKAFFTFMRTDPQFMPFKTADQVLDSFRRIYAIIEPSLPKYFELFPKSKFEIRQTEAFRAASASIEYIQGTPDGKRPGIFYVPVVDATKFNITSGMESTFLHEAVPGHHYQGSLQMEDTSLPEFRRFKWYGAYGEGWALYCESMGKELGLYKNPYQYMGALGDEMHRAIRLVVDVAIHSKGMTREQAIAYMMENEPVSEESAVAEIERYMAVPGQALSYKIGALKIRELRDKYSKQLGVGFDIRQFHKEVLNSGCLPLTVMEDKLDQWATNAHKTK